MTDLTFRDINRLFIFSFKNGNDDLERNSFSKRLQCIKQLIKHDNALVDNKEAYETKKKRMKLIDMSRNDNYTTRIFLHYLYHQKYYKLISIDLSTQKNTSIHQKINFEGK